MRLCGLVFTATVALDQLTKLWVRHAIGLRDLWPVVEPCFDLCHVENPGAAWGMFAGRRWALLAVSAVSAAVFWACRRTLLAGGRVGQVLTGLLFGGLVGNAIDRAVFGTVTDFLRVHWRDVWDFPAFNVADSAICVAAGLYLLRSILESRGRAARAPTTSGDPEAGQ